MNMHVKLDNIIQYKGNPITLQLETRYLLETLGVSNEIYYWWGTGKVELKVRYQKEATELHKRHPHGAYDL